MVRRLGRVKVVKHNGTYAWVKNPYDNDVVKRKMRSDRWGEYVVIENKKWGLKD